MSRLPLAAASRNMSACSAQAMSQVGCRLMVASRANTSRAFAPAAWGDIARALARKVAMSSAADGRASGSEPARPATGFGAVGTSPVSFGRVGSRDIDARNGYELYVEGDTDAVNAPSRLRVRFRRSVGDGGVSRHRLRFGDFRRLGVDGRQHAVVVQELVEQGLNF